MQLCFTLPVLIRFIVLIIEETALWALQIHKLSLLICIYAICTNLGNLDLQLLRVDSSDCYPPLVIVLLQLVETHIEFIQ
jgi:hypothetical protein